MRILALAVGGALYALCGYGVTNETLVLNPVVVYASRIDATAADMPSCVCILDRSEIAASGARDLPELLSKKAGLDIRTLNANPLQSRISLRGFGENAFGRVKVILDGVELNGVDMEPPDLSRVALESVTRVEVLPGPNPVLHGDGAEAGVIVISTDSTDAEPRTEIMATGGSHGSFGAAFRTSGSVADDGLLYAASYGYRRGDGYRARSGFGVHTADASLRRLFKNGSSFGLRANYSHAFYEMPGALSSAQMAHDRRQARYWDDWCRLWNYAVSADGKVRLGDDQWLYIDATFDVRHRTTHWGDYGYANDYDLYGWRIAPRYVNERAVGSYDQTFTAGLDIHCDLYRVQDRSSYNNWHYDFCRDRIAPYAEEELFLTDEISVRVGARLETIGNRWFHYQGLSDNRSRDTLGDGEIALVYRLLENTKTFVKATRFHRSAFCDELNYTQDGTFLEPETGESLDAGVEAEITREIHADFSGYWNMMRDEIFYNPYAKEYGGGACSGYNCNSPGRTSRLGFDAGVGWLREKTAEASVRYAFTEARFVDGDYAGKTVPLVPQSRVRAEVGVWIGPEVEVKCGASYVTAQNLGGDYENAHEKLRGYELFDVGVVYRPSWIDGWRLSAWVDNLLDREYCDYAGWSDSSGAYYYPACGRNFRVMLRYAF